MKARALHILQQMDIPEYATSDRELWTYKLVREALVDAFRLLRATGGRVGPQGMAAYWPDFHNPEDFPEEKTRTSPYHTRMTTTRMEMVLLGGRDEDGRAVPGWLQGLPDTHVQYRPMLEAWIFAELRGESSVDLCERMKWPRATFKRHRDRAAGAIAIRLNVAKVEVW